MLQTLCSFLNGEATTRKVLEICKEGEGVQTKWDKLSAAVTSLEPALYCGFGRVRDSHPTDGIWSDSEDSIFIAPALPPDVRRWLCLAVPGSTRSGLRPWCGLCPDSLRATSNFARHLLK